MSAIPPLGPAGTSSRRQISRSLLARVATLVPSALTTLLASRLVIDHYGIAAFGAFSVLTSLLLLLPLNSLGAGGAVTNAFAEFGPDEQHSRGVTLTAARLLAGSSVITIAITIVLAIAGLWPGILGLPDTSNRFVALAICLWALSFVPGLGQSMLLGIHRNEVAVIIQSMLQPATFLAVAGLVVLDVGAPWIVVVPSLAFLVVNVGHAAVAARAARFSWAAVLRILPLRRTNPGASIRAIAGPLFVSSIAVPLGLQCDRIILSHVSTTQAVADYTVAIQLFAPLIALVGAAAAPLWPIYARARADGSTGPPIVKVVAVFVAFTAACCAVLVPLADPLGRVIGADEVHLGVLLPVAAACSAILQSAAYPIGMALMDERGVRFVATALALSLPANIGLSIVLGSAIGAPGPLFATAAAGFVFGVLPPFVLARRRERAARTPAQPA